MDTFACTTDVRTAVTAVTKQSVLKRAWNVLWRIPALMFRRRIVTRMGELSDHELADIGLMRSDLTGVLSGPFLSDPTAALNQCARRPDIFRRIGC